MPAHTTVTVDSPKAEIRWKVHCTPLRTVDFFDSSLGDEFRLWVFGDGTTSTVRDPVHTYPLPIIYSGYLATYNSRSGCRDTAGFAFDFTRPTTTFKFKPVCRGAADTLIAITAGATKPKYLWSAFTSHFKNNISVGDTVVEYF